MRFSKNGCKLVLVFSVFCLLATPAFAQAQTQPQTQPTTQGQSRPTSTDDRLFLNFAEDATVAEKQWWEGQIELVDFDPTDAVILRGIVAFQPLKDVEVGGRVGFGNTDAPFGLQDGSGATDLDIWGKFYFTAGASNTEFALGGLATIPTGDDSAGLGFDAFAFEIFGALRHRLNKLVITANAGLRITDDGQVQGFNLDGENSPFIAGGVILPLSDKVSFIGEADLEGERFDGADEDTRILGGINWRVFNRGLFRGAVAIGLTDGAPDSQLLFGYAQSF